MSDLTKWPRLLVTGTPITEEQANDVLIRTAAPWLLQCNDEDWNTVVYRAIGVLGLDEYGSPDYAALRAAADRLGCLDLGYLYNSRISSVWVGGPHGWCDWDGRIGCATYNIGKWPSRDGITAEWERIAAAFPYLDLTAQLVADEGTGPVAGQWRVRDGHAEQCTPGAPVTGPVELSEETFLERILSLHAERGVTADRLTAAVAQVLAARNAT